MLPIELCWTSTVLPSTVVACRTSITSNVVTAVPVARSIAFCALPTNTVEVNSSAHGGPGLWHEQAEAGRASAPTSASTIATHARSWTCVGHRIARA